LVCQEKCRIKKVKIYGGLIYRKGTGLRAQKWWFAGFQPILEDIGVPAGVVEKEKRLFDVIKTEE